MKFTVKYPRVFRTSSLLFSTCIRAILNVLLAVILVGMIVSVFKSGFDVWHDIHHPLEEILRDILLDAVFILALVEVANTILGYLQDGRVHVRFIIDTVLIIMLNEVVTTWFTHPTVERSGALAIILGTLTVVRISVTHWAPSKDD